MMNFFDAALLGIVEGVTEFLPVSSTGHMILTSHLLGIAEHPFTKLFEIVIQLAAILAVVVVYWRTLITGKEILLKIACAFIPTAILGLVFHSLIKKYLLGNSTVVVSALFIGGLIIIAFEYFKGKKNLENTADLIGAREVTHSKSLADISYKKSFYIGLWQSLAMVPGVSRSAATIIGGEAMGIKRTSIVEFSFLLAIPTMLAAASLDLISSDLIFGSNEIWLLSIGCIVSFMVALLAIKTFLKYIKNHSFAIFGYYRIILAILYALFFL